MSAISELKTINNLVPYQANYRATHGFRLVAPKHWKPTYRQYQQFHILYLRSGNCRFFVDDTSHEMMAGSLIFLSPHVNHRIEHDINNPPDISTIFFDLFDNVNLTKVFPENSWSIHYNAVDVKCASLIEQVLFLTMDPLTSIDRERKSAITLALLIDLLIEQQSTELQQKVNQSDERVKQTVVRLRKNPHQRFSVAELAHFVNAKPDYLTRLFTKEMGISLKSFQVKSRLEYAMHILRSTDTHVNELARELGYSSINTFSRQFKDFFGYPPSKAKKS